MDLNRTAESKIGGASILVACALRKEAALLRPSLGGDVELLVTGVGRRRTRETLSRRLRSTPPSTILFSGTSGQLDPSVPMGAVICPEVWCTEDGTEHRLCKTLAESLEERGWEIQGKGLTVRRPVLRASTRLKLFRQTGARICDMEAAEALAVALEFGIPLLAPKVVSDTGQESITAFWTNFEANLGRLAAYLQKLITDLRDASLSPSCGAGAAGQNPPSAIKASTDGG